MLPKSHPESQTEIISVDELASRVGKHPQTIYRWMRSKPIPHLRIGKSIRFRWPQVLDHWEGDQK